jgi:hypothetical protein
LRIGQELYFTIYVNSGEGWCRLYRYDLGADRLTDLAIAEQDGSVGVRDFHGDPYQTNCLWVLSGSYGGAVQMPRHWFRYERDSRKLVNLGVSYSGIDSYTYESGTKAAYLKLIRFVPERAEFLGRDEKQPLRAIAAYDRETQ